MGDYDGIPGPVELHKGGNGGFTQALARAVEGFGGRVRTGAGVERVVYDDGRATAVLLSTGRVWPRT